MTLTVAKRSYSFFGSSGKNLRNACLSPLYGGTRSPFAARNRRPSSTACLKRTRAVAPIRHATPQLQLATNRSVPPVLPMTSQITPLSTPKAMPSHIHISPAANNANPSWPYSRSKRTTSGVRFFCCILWNQAALCRSGRNSRWLPWFIANPRLTRATRWRCRARWRLRRCRAQRWLQRRGRTLWCHPQRWHHQRQLSPLQRI